MIFLDKAQELLTVMELDRLITGRLQVLDKSTQQIDLEELAIENVEETAISATEWYGS